MEDEKYVIILTGTSAEGRIIKLDWFDAKSIAQLQQANKELLDIVQTLKGARF